MKSAVKWLENFWYHYKWLVLIIGFFVISGAIMLVQYVQKDDYDLLILYTGPEIPTANEVRGLENAFAAVMEEDRDGDGKKEPTIDALFLMTEEQINDKKYQYDENGNPIVINTSEMLAVKNQFSTQMIVGEALICLLDPNWYEIAKKEKAFVKLDELVDTVPETAYDEYAVPLRQTAFGEYFTAVNALPEDTLICFRRMSTASGQNPSEDEKERYEYNKNVFINILEYTPGGKD